MVNSVLLLPRLRLISYSPFLDLSIVSILSTRKRSIFSQRSCKRPSLDEPIRWMVLDPLKILFWNENLSDEKEVRKKDVRSINT